MYPHDELWGNHHRKNLSTAENPLTDGVRKGRVRPVLVPQINETGSRSLCMRPRSNPPKMKNSNVVRSRLIILINEEINEANWMVSNSAKLDSRTKQDTQFGVSASNGSRDMARTKSWRKKRKKLKKKQLTKRIGW